MHPDLDMADLQLLEALPGAGPGVLWRARFRPTGHLLAVRIVQRPPAGRRAAIARAARRAMEADHPHVVTAYAFAQNAPTGALVLVREWLEAGPVPGGHKPFLVAARLAGEALSGLAFLHALGIAHGDLRASHLLQGHASGPVRIADPGLSWATLLDGSPTVAGDLAAFGLIVRDWFDPAEKPEIAHWLDRLLGAEQAYESAPEARDALAELAPEVVPKLAHAGLHASLPEDTGRAGWLPGLPSEGWGGRPLPLVGRDTEQRTLWAAIERARAESRPVGVVVRGEPGQGSRALLRCVSTRAAEAGLVRTLQVWHGPVPGPGQGLGAALRRALDLGGVSGPERVARLEQQLSRLEIPSADREVFRAWLVGGPERTPGPLFRYDAMLRFVEKYRRGRTIFLWIEDAQWGRDALCFAHHLLTRGGQIPVVLGLSLREPAPAGGWDPLLTALLERPDVGELSLGRLGNASMRELLVGHLGLSPAASARISAMAGGNPLFGVEQVRALRRSGALQPGGGGASLAPGDALVGDIEAVWVERLRLALARRPADDGVLLRLAAIFGGVCQLDELWEAAQEMGLRSSEDLLDTMEAEGLLRLDLSAGELRFAHGSLVRTLVRQAARTGHTRHLHEAIEAVLARRSGEGPAGISRRVRHRLGSGDGPAAVALALTGAEERLSAGEPVPARALLDQVEAAAEALSPADPRRGYFLNLRGYSALLEGKNAQVLRHAARAELEARRWGWPQVGAAGALQRAVLGIREGAWETALHDIEAAERAGRSQGDPLLGLLCSLHRCRLELRRGDLGRAETHLVRLDALQAALGEMLEGERWRLHAELAFEIGGDPGPALDKARQYCSGWGLAELDTQAGLHLRAGGRAAEARVCFGRSHAQHRALGTAPAFSPSLGLALLSLDRGDPGEAGRYLDQAASNPGGSLGARTLHPLISARLVLENGAEALTHRFVAAVHRSLDGQVLRDRLCGEQARALSDQARRRGLLALANESERLAMRLQATVGPEIFCREPEER